MPATAGKVRMPAGNRQSTSSSLNTHSIWQNAIGYDPYAAAAPSDASAGASAEAAKTQYENMKGLLQLAKMAQSSKGEPSDDGRGGWQGRGKLRGDPCPVCDGEGITTVQQQISVDIPAGAPTGHEITFRGQGDEHPHRATGDLIVVVELAEHPVFSRQYDDSEHLYCNSSVGLLDALIGFDKKLTGLDGERLNVRHSRTAFSSFTHELRGHGLPVFGNETQRGSLSIFIRVSFPQSLTTLQHRVLKQVGLRDEELDFIIILQALMAYQYAQTVQPDSDELKFSRQCIADTANSCTPDPPYWTWWRAVV